MGSYRLTKQDGPSPNGKYLKRLAKTPPPELRSTTSDTRGTTPALPPNHTSLPYHIIKKTCLNPNYTHPFTLGLTETKTTIYRYWRILNARLLGKQALGLMCI